MKCTYDVDAKMQNHQLRYPQSFKSVKHGNSKKKFGTVVTKDNQTIKWRYVIFIVKEIPNPINPGLPATSTYVIVDWNNFAFCVDCNKQVKLKKVHQNLKN